MLLDNLAVSLNPYQPQGAITKLQNVIYRSSCLFDYVML